MASAPQQNQQIRQAYWEETSRLTWIIVMLWFIAWVGPLILHYPFNTIVILGFPLSFWFAGQGSLVIFIVLIVVYAIRMNKIDRKYGLQED